VWTEEGLADRVYEASVLPELWPDVLRRIASLTDGAGSVVLSVRGHDVRYMTSSAELDVLAAEYFKAFPGTNERMRRLLETQRAGFVTDAEVFSPEERATEPIFRDFLTPRGYGNGVATALSMPTGEFIVFHTEGRSGTGPWTPPPVAALDALRPHLARSAYISSRLSFERARTAVDTLHGLGLAACAVTRSGAVMVANAEFERETGYWTTRGGGRIALEDRRADELLRGTLAAGGTGVCSLPLVPRGPEPPAVLHVVPMRRAAQDLFTHAVAILVLTKASSEPTTAIPLLQTLFDLSPAEAEIAARIAAGATPLQIAAASGRSVSTVRNQLKSVLAKTGCRRQADLTRLLVQLRPSVG